MGYDFFVLLAAVGELDEAFFGGFTLDLGAGALQLAGFEGGHGGL